MMMIRGGQELERVDPLVGRSHPTSGQVEAHNYLPPHPPPHHHPDDPPLQYDSNHHYHDDPHRLFRWASTT